MKSTVIGINLRTLSKSIRLMSKYSDQIKILAIEDSLILQSINAEDTVFCQVVFEKDFFQSFQNDNDFECKVDIRSIGLVFRVACLDKITNSCEIVMDNSMDRINFRMECPNRVKRIFSIPILENNDHKRCPVPISRQMSKPTLQCDANTMFELFKPFPLSADEIIFWTFRDHLSFKTYYENDYEGPMTEFCVSSALFNTNDSFYNYTNEMSNAFDLRDLRAFLDFAVHRNRIISAYLQSNGNPIEFTFKNSNGCSASIIMATIDLETSTQRPVPPTFRTTRRIVDDSSSGSVMQNTSLDTRTSQEIPMNQSMEQQSNHVLNSTISRITNSSPPDELMQVQSNQHASNSISTFSSVTTSAIPPTSSEDSMEQQSSEHISSSGITSATRSHSSSNQPSDKQPSPISNQSANASDHLMQTENIEPNNDFDNDNDDDFGDDIIKQIMMEDNDNELTSSQFHFLRGDHDGDNYDERLDDILASFSDDDSD